MSKKSIVLAALAVAMTSAPANALPGPDTNPADITAGVQAPSISLNTREFLLNSATTVGGYSSAEQLRVAAVKKSPKFRLFDNGPTFVKAVKPKID